MDRLINVETIKQEMGKDSLDSHYDNEKENPYKSIIINDFDRLNVNF